MNKIKLAYIAGVMDSDGSITIAVDMWRVKKKGQNPAFQEMVAIGQCDPQAVYLIQELFGGNVRIEKSRGKNRRPMHFWQASNTRAIAFINAIYPFLRIKRKQADIVLALRKIKDRGRKANTEYAGPRIRRLKPEVLEEMNSLVLQVRELNDSRTPVPLSH